MGFKDRLKNAIASEISDGDNYLASLISRGIKEIKLREDIEISETVTIDNDDIVIDGCNHTIDACGKTQIFNIKSNNVTLKNINFKNAYTNNPGGAIFNLEGEVKIINCNFINNRTFGGDGGAIYNKNGNVTIDECDFRDNTAKFGGAIYNGNTITVTLSNFSNNHSSKGLSIFNRLNSKSTLSICNFKRDDESMLNINPEIYNMGIITVERFQKQIIQNMTQGGFIHINSDNVKTFQYLDDLIRSGEKEIKLDCDIEFEDSYTGKLIIDEDNITIDGCDHIIDGMGKSDILKINGNGVTLKNINFRNGSADEGAAIVNRSNSLTLVNCNFECNISHSSGAIDNYGKIDAENCNFEKNIANEICSGAIDNKGELNLTKCNFIGNSSIRYGGAINNANTLSLYDCYFESNISENGASVNNGKNASVTILKSVFENNKAFKQGSIIYNDNYANMNDCKSTNNISNKYSNIIFQNGDENSRLEIENCIFSRDSFNNNLIFIENGSCNIKSTKFSLNRAHKHSYTIYNENGIVELENIDFENIKEKTIFNNNALYVKKDEGNEKYIDSGNDSLPLKYN